MQTTLQYTRERASETTARLFMVTSPGGLGPDRQHVFPSGTFAYEFSPALHTVFVSPSNMSMAVSFRHKNIELRESLDRETNLRGPLDTASMKPRPKIKSDVWQPVLTIQARE